MDPIPMLLSNMILRGGNKRKHMKNNKKDIVQGAPGITLYPVKQFRKVKNGRKIFLSIITVIISMRRIRFIMKEL
jgi:hypothetical protein